MEDNSVFIDTNILVYSILEDKNHIEKTQKAISLLNNLNNKNVYISTQVLSELYSSLLKHKLDDKSIQEKLDLVVQETIVASITLETAKTSWDIRNKYNYSYWDSLIIASAIENNCTILYSEDMHNFHDIENSFKIKNPFV
jgi:predicted nucleic acid-binding protein